MERHVRNGKWAGVLGMVAASVLLFGAAQSAKSMPAPQDTSGPTVLTKMLPDGQVGKDFFKAIQAIGGKPPWNFSAKGQTDGLSFDTVRGPNTTDVLHGKPTAAGDFEVEVTVTDSANPPQSSSTKLKLHINP